MSPTSIVDFAHLPTELKLGIFEELHRTGTGFDYTNALRVCKKWNELGTPLLWTNVSINNDTLLPFVRSLTTVRDCIGKTVRSLSIALNPVPQTWKALRKPLVQLGFSSDEFVLIEDELQVPDYLRQMSQAKVPSYDNISPGNTCLAIAIMALAELIEKSLTLVQTFSFRFATWPTDPYATFIVWSDAAPFPPRVLARLIRSLPLSCLQIEICTSGRDNTSHLETHNETKEAADELSAAMAEVLPRLTHLSLDAAYVAPFIFEHLVVAELLPVLQHLFIDATNLTVTDERCKKYVSTAVPQYLYLEIGDNFTSTQSLQYSETFQNCIVQGLSKSRKSGRYPSVQTMELVVYQSPTFDEVCRNLVDIIKERIRVHPIAVLRLRSEDRASTLDAYTFFPDEKSQLILMDENQVGNYSNAAWISSTTEVRFPDVERDTRAVRKHGLRWTNPLDAGLPPEAFVDRVKTTRGQSSADWFDAKIEEARPMIRRPYVIEGLFV